MHRHLDFTHHLLIRARQLSKLAGIRAIAIPCCQLGALRRELVDRTDCFES